MNFVIVDDYLPNRIVLEALLETIGYTNIKTFSGGYKCIKYIENNLDHVDVLLLDYKMPGLSGSEVISYLYKKCNIDKLPIIIILSAYDWSYIENDFKDYNVYFLLKPINEQKFIKILKTAIIDKKKDKEDK